MGIERRWKVSTNTTRATGDNAPAANLYGVMVAEFAQVDSAERGRMMLEAPYEFLWTSCDGDEDIRVGDYLQPQDSAIVESTASCLVRMVDVWPMRREQVCKRVVVEDPRGLTTCDIQRVTFVTGDGGTYTETWATVAEDVPCRIASRNRMTAMSEGTDGNQTQASYQLVLTVARHIDLRAADRVVSGGDTYEVVSLEANPEWPQQQAILAKVVA